MKSLETLQSRLKFNGGNAQQARMNESKLKSLKRALLYSYQAATAILSDGREFRCLINPDKLKYNYDDKIISIPFKDICLNADKIKRKTMQDIENINMQPGDVFTWKENGSHWIVYSRRLEETAYFRAEIRRCDDTVEIDGKSYHAYVRGPEQLSLEWRKGNYEMFNKENYTLMMYITKDAVTEDYFHRFTRIKIKDKPWEIQTVDSITSEGIIKVALKETYQNTIEDQVIKEEEEKKPIQPVIRNIYIDGPQTVSPYDTVKYTIKGITGGTWSVDNEKIKIVSSDDTLVKLNINTGRSGKFKLIYTLQNEEQIQLDVEIESL